MDVTPPCPFPKDRGFVQKKSKSTICHACKCSSRSFRVNLRIPIHDGDCVTARNGAFLQNLNGLKASPSLFRGIVITRNPHDSHASILIGVRPQPRTQQTTRRRSEWLVSHEDMVRAYDLCVDAGNPIISLISWGKRVRVK